MMARIEALERRVAELEEKVNYCWNNNCDTKKDAPAIFANDNVCFDKDCKVCKPEAKAVKQNNWCEVCKDYKFGCRCNEVKPQPTTHLAEEQTLEDWGELHQEIWNKYTNTPGLNMADVQWIIGRVRSHNPLPKDKILVDRKVAEEWLKDIEKTWAIIDLRNELRKAVENNKEGRYEV